MTIERDVFEAGPDEGLARRLAPLHLVPIWDTGAAIARQDIPRPVAHVWRWEDISRELSHVAETNLDGAAKERRILLLNNPGLPLGAQAAVPNLCGAVQMILAGEMAPAHRHTYSALRFVLSGRGARTVVEGREIEMRRGDFLLTPGWTWHDHALGGAGEPMIWFDSLDSPWVANMQAAVYQNHPSGAAQPMDGSAPEMREFGGASMLVGRGRRDRPAVSPQLAYRWADSEPLLRDALERGAVDPAEGAVFEYVNPVTGGHVMPTIACFLHGLPKGFRSLARRRTSASLCVVLHGSGTTIIDGKPHRWSERDVIAEPAWSWIEYHVDEEAAVFRVSDQPLLEPFGLDRVEDHPDRHQPVELDERQR